MLLHLECFCASKFRLKHSTYKLHCNLHFICYKKPCFDHFGYSAVQVMLDGMLVWQGVLHRASCAENATTIAIISSERPQIPPSSFYLGPRGARGAIAAYHPTAQQDYILPAAPRTRAGPWGTEPFAEAAPSGHLTDLSGFRPAPASFGLPNLAEATSEQILAEVLKRNLTEAVLEGAPYPHPVAAAAAAAAATFSDRRSRSGNRSARQLLPPAAEQPRDGEDAVELGSQDQVLLGSVSRPLSAFGAAAWEPSPDAESEDPEAISRGSTSGARRPGSTSAAILRELPYDASSADAGCADRVRPGGSRRPGSAAVAAAWKPPAEAGTADAEAPVRVLSRGLPRPPSVFATCTRKSPSPDPDAAESRGFDNAPPGGARRPPSTTGVREPCPDNETALSITVPMPPEQLLSSSSQGSGALTSGQSSQSDCFSPNSDELSPLGPAPSGDGCETRPPGCDPVKLEVLRKQSYLRRRPGPLKERRESGRRASASAGDGAEANGGFSGQPSEVPGRNVAELGLGGRGVPYEGVPVWDAGEGYPSPHPSGVDQEGSRDDRPAWLQSQGRPQGSLALKGGEEDLGLFRGPVSISDGPTAPLGKKPLSGRRAGTTGNKGFCYTLDLSYQ